MSRFHRYRPIALLAALIALILSLSATEIVHAQDAPPTLADEAAAIQVTISRLEEEFRAMRRSAESLEDSDDRAVQELQKRQILFEWMRAVKDLVANVVAQQAVGLDTTAHLQPARKLLFSLNRRLPTFLDQATAENGRLREALAEAPESAKAGLRSQLVGNEEVIDETVRFYLEHIRHLDALGRPSKQIRDQAASRLEDRAANLAARLELESNRLDAIQGQSSEGSEVDPALDEAELQEHVDQIAASLWTTCDVMDELGLPTAKHRKALILATGEISTDLLDTEVVGSLIDDWIEAGSRWIERRGPVILGQVAIFLSVLLVFWTLGRILRLIVQRLLGSEHHQISELARRIILETTSRAVFIAGLLFALSQVGVNVAALLAGLGIAGFIVGFALQETLGNFAAGTMILIYRPFDVGDVIEAAGVMGQVDSMSLVSTTILTFDNQMLIVPNSQIWGNVIRNATALDRRRVDLTFPLALDTDIPAAEALFAEICESHPAVLAEPKPAIRVSEVGATGAVFIVRPWVRTEDYWATFWELTREAQVRLAEAGIRIATTRYEIESHAHDRDDTKAPD